MTELAHDQLERQHVRMDVPAGPVFGQQVNGALRQVLDRLANRGERRPDDFGHWGIVETGYGYAVWNVASGAMQCEHHARSHVIVRARERRDLNAVAKQALAGIHA